MNRPDLWFGPRESMADAPPGRLHVIDLDLARYDALAKRQRREHDDGVAVLKAGIARPLERS